MNEPIDTRVGQILDDDNRFLGRSVFEDWVDELVAQPDAMLAALGVRELTDINREAMRLIVLSTTSPDARVWPLKLTRLLASYGNPSAAYFAAQLVSTSKVMGPGTAMQAANALVWIAEQVGEHPSDEAVTEATRTWRARVGGRVGGFGVPFRAQDERRIGLLRLTAGTAIEQRRFWRLHTQVVAALSDCQPNVVISVAALLLDIGVAPELCGLALSISMAHVFLAHAVEAARVDGARAHALAAELVEYRGRPARAISRSPSSSAAADQSSSPSTPDSGC